MSRKVLKLISPIPPSVNHYLGYRTVKKGGKYLAVSYKKPEAVKYQKNLGTSIMIVFFIFLELIWMLTITLNVC